MMSPGSRRAARREGIRLATITVTYGDRDRLDVVPLRPLHQELVGREDPGDRQRILGDGIGDQGPHGAPDDGADPQDDDRLPEEDPGDVLAGVAHRAQDRDFLCLFQDDHGQCVEHRQSRNQGEDRHRDGRRHSKGPEDPEPGLFPLLPGVAPCAGARSSSRRRPPAPGPCRKGSPAGNWRPSAS